MPHTGIDKNLSSISFHAVINAKEVRELESRGIPRPICPIDMPGMLISVSSKNLKGWLFNHASHYLRTDEVEILRDECNKVLEDVEEARNRMVQAINEQ